MELSSNKRLVFIGDSITEWGRNDGVDNIGSGYVRLIHDYLITTYPDKFPEMINRGVGGDRITNLQARWQEDVIDLNPDFLSISIGINDVWRQLDSQDPDQIYPDRFEEIYIELLTKVKEQTNAQIILMEPTVIEEDIHAEGNQKLVPYVESVQKLAANFNAIYVPTHHAFVSYLKHNNQYKLTSDGVHMNSAGNMLMAQTWIQAFEQGLAR